MVHLWRLCVSRGDQSHLRITSMSYVRNVSILCIVSFQVDSYSHEHPIFSPARNVYRMPIRWENRRLDFAQARLSRAIK